MLAIKNSPHSKIFSITDAKFRYILSELHVRKRFSFKIQLARMGSFSIVGDEDVFSETFIPEKLVCREGQIKEISRCLAPAKSKKSIRNLFIWGPPGVGKTVVTRSVLTDNFSKNSVYVNCWSKQTSHKIWEDILLQMGYVIHGRESTSELVKKFEKSGRKVIVCLDEADQLKDTDMLYVLARNSCGVILISNTSSILSTIDDRVRSSLLLSEIEFKPYSREEVSDILNERVKHGIRAGAISDSLLRIIAGMANGDARIGLQIIRAASLEAESKGKSSVSIEEVKVAAKSARKYRLSYILGKLNEHQRAVYAILKRSREMESGGLYIEYCKTVKFPVVDRAYRKHMQRLEELGLVRSMGSGRWKKFELAS